MNHQTQITMTKNGDQLLEEQITPLADTTKTVLSDNASPSSTTQRSNIRHDPVFLFRLQILFMVVLFGLVLGGYALINIICDTNDYSDFIRTVLRLFLTVASGLGLLIMPRICGYFARIRISNWIQNCWHHFCLRPKENSSEYSHSTTIDNSHKNTRFVSQAGKEIVTRDSNFDGLLHDPVEENITSILHVNENFISSKDYTELMRITSPFHITVETLAHLMTTMEKHCQMGLEPNTNSSSDLKMLPTYVTNLPTRKEQGDILALDLGGTNFRTLLVKLHPNNEPQVISEAHIVPDSKKLLANDLFEFIVDVLKQFMIRNQLDLEQEYVLGFTFSFACEQIALNKGKFLTPSKGWVLSDLIGQDVVQVLQRIIYQKQLKVKITALINDTVGTLMACAYHENTCRVGVILGTGTNACYFEDINKIHTISDRAVLPTEATEMIINTEWGALGEGGCLDMLITNFDREIDRISNNPGIHIFEKLISGMYMGRLAAEVLASLINQGIILKTQRDHKQSYRYYGPFHALYMLQTSHISEIELDTGHTFANTRNVLKKLGLDYATNTDCAIISYTCRLISRRAAMLTAAAIAVLMKRLHENKQVAMKKICIGIDGSLYRFHPRFNMVIQRHLKILAPVLLNYELRISADGSGIGAAICAITANDARQALHKGEIQKSSFYQQHNKIP
ncbi:unnamed protein product [Adineta steineri]|uniref:hexokinase n=1 Tax=Adineta steineri TaxID=433720 RepID=A0A813X039_9BILA|nr:unnamed protein product [Adineta steineri]CAF0822580.1 unnamed protein product [Adineta steineri]CAF0863052.1 unnamed protein product [Adineta steineri]